MSRPRYVPANHLLADQSHIAELKRRRGNEYREHWRRRRGPPVAKCSQCSSTFDIKKDSALYQKADKVTWRGEHWYLRSADCPVCQQQEEATYSFFSWEMMERPSNLILQTVQRED